MIKRKKIIRCEVCKEPLKHVQNNQWMCDQNLTQCDNSLKIVFTEEPIEEEE